MKDDTRLPEVPSDTSPRREAGARPPSEGPIRALRDFRSLSKHTANYFAGQLVTRFVGFLLLPLFTRFLDTSQFGIVAMVMSVSSVASVVFVAGLRSSFARFYWDYKGDRRELGELLTTLLLTIALFTALCFAVAFIGGKPLLESAIEGVPFSPYILMGLLIAAVGIPSQFWLTLCQVRERSLQYMLFSTSQFLLASAGSVVFVVLLDEQALGRLKGQLYVGAAFAVIAVVLLMRTIVPRISVSKLRAALRYGLPLIPHELSAWITSLFDRLALGAYRGLGDVGVYSVSYTIGGVISIITTAFNFAFVPYFMKLATSSGEDAKQRISAVATLWTAVMVFVALFVSAFAREIVFVMSQRSYHSGWSVIPIVALGFVFQGFYYLVVAGVFYNKRFTKFVPIATFTGAAANILGNMLLIPRHGMMGAAWATAGSLFITFVIAYYFSQRAYPIPYQYGRIGRATAGGLAIYGLTVLVDRFVAIAGAAVAIKLVLVGAFPAAIIWLRVVDREAYGKMVALVRSVLRGRGGNGSSSGR